MRYSGQNPRSDAHKDVAKRSWRGLAAVFLSVLAFGVLQPAHGAQSSSTGYEIEVDVLKVEPIVVRERVFRPERVCREHYYQQRDRRSNNGYRNRSRNYHNPNHRGHSDACYGYGYNEPAQTQYRLEPVASNYRCRTIERERIVERVDGYAVTYLYNDREITKRLDYDPGSKLRIRVQAQPQVSRFNQTPQTKAYPKRSLTL